MPDDPIMVLERELVEAARRRGVTVDLGAASQEPRGPWPSAPRPARRRSSLGGFAAVVLSGVALVVALGALVSLHGHKAPAHRAVERPASIPGRQQLIDIIAVLRRPQTKADLDPRVLSGLSNTPPIALLAVPDRSLIRFAATTPWGERFYLVPYRPSTRLNRGETLGLMSPGGGGGGATAAGVEAGTEMQIDGAGRSFAGGSTQTRYVLVVPDGVARVKFSFPAQAVTVPVRGNVAAVQVDRQCCAGQPALIWYSAAGRVMKRIAGTP